MKYGTGPIIQDRLLERGADLELWERPPEEWELDRVEPMTGDEAATFYAHHLEHELRERVFAALMKAQRVPFTDAALNIVRAAIEDTLREEQRMSGADFVRGYKAVLSHDGATVEVTIDTLGV